MTKLSSPVQQIFMFIWFDGEALRRSACPDLVIEVAMDDLKQEGQGCTSYELETLHFHWDQGRSTQRAIVRAQDEAEITTLNNKTNIQLRVEAGGFVPGPQDKGMESQPGKLACVFASCTQFSIEIKRGFLNRNHEHELRSAPCELVPMVRSGKKVSGLI